MRPSGMIWLVMSASLFLATPSTTSIAQTILTNKDIVKLSAAGLSDEVIIAKIQQAPEVAFDLEVDDLLALREAGVSEGVVTAMLERTTPTEEPVSPAPSGQTIDMRDDLGIEVIKVELATNEGSTPLRLLRGELTTSGFLIVFTFMDYPGLQATVRTSDRRPTLLVRSRAPLTGGRFFWAKLDSDTDDGLRSLKISSVKNRFRAIGGSSRSFTEPDHDWVIDYEVSQEGTDLWRVTPSEELEPGEYGWYVDFGSQMQSNGIYDFGVD